MVHFSPVFAFPGNAMKVTLIKVVMRNEVGNNASVCSKERFHIRGHIAHHGQIPQRLDPETGSQALHQRAASKLLPAINHHRARTAHSDAARESKGQIRTRPALQREQRVEHAGFLSELEFMSFETRFFAWLHPAALNAHTNRRHESSMRSAPLRGNDEFQLRMVSAKLRT
jgi:hypothetical protein